MTKDACLGLTMKQRNGQHCDRLRQHFSTSPLHVKKLTKSGITIMLHHCRPNTAIFFFGAQTSEVVKPWHVAYGKLENSGIVRVNKDGIAIVKMQCPGVYTDVDGKTNKRHMHFVYWDSKRKTWEVKTHTRSIECGVSLRKSSPSAALVIDARTPQEFKNKHSKHSINIPHDTAIRTLKRMFVNKLHTPLHIIGGELAHKLIKSLAKIGAHNTWYIKSRQSSTATGGWDTRHTILPVSVYNLGVRASTRLTMREAIQSIYIDPSYILRIEYPENTDVLNKDVWKVWKVTLRDIKTSNHNVSHNDIGLTDYVSRDEFVHTAENVKGKYDSDYDDLPSIYINGASFINLDSKTLGFLMDSVSFIYKDHTITIRIVSDNVHIHLDSKPFTIKSVLITLGIFIRIYEKSKKMKITKIDYSKVYIVCNGDHQYPFDVLPYASSWNTPINCSNLTYYYKTKYGDHTTTAEQHNAKMRANNQTIRKRTLVQQVPEGFTTFFPLTDRPNFFLHNLFRRSVQRKGTRRPGKSRPTYAI